MKEITAFYLHGCPYCQKAKQSIQELIQEHPAYGAISLHWYEESEHPEMVQGHSYYYVPSMFIGNEKCMKHSRGRHMMKLKDGSNPYLKRH